MFTPPVLCGLVLVKTTAIVQVDLGPEESYLLGYPCTRRAYLSAMRNYIGMACERERGKRRVARYGTFSNP
jgi:hypothetical protein